MGWNPYLPNYTALYQPQMSLPTIRAEIIQVDSEEQAAAYPVNAGASQMMIARDDSAIYVKTVGANGPNLDVFVKRPPAPPAPAPEYMTREEVEAMIAGAIAPKRITAKKAVEE